MKRTIIAAATVGLGYCGACHSGDLPSALIGRWSMPPSRAFASSSPGCADVSLEFTEDNRLIVTSGALVYTVAVAAQSEGTHLYTIGRVVEHNDQPNCQGFPASYVLSHLSPLVRAEAVGRELIFAMLDVDGTPYGAPERFIKVLSIGPTTAQPSPRGQ